MPANSYSGLRKAVSTACAILAVQGLAATTADRDDGPKFGPKRDDTERNRPVRKGRMASLKQLTLINFRCGPLADIVISLFLQMPYMKGGIADTAVSTLA